MDGDNHSSWKVTIQDKRDELQVRYTRLYGTLRDEMECEIGADEVLEMATKLRALEVRIYELEGLL